MSRRVERCHLVKQARAFDGQWAMLVIYLFDWSRLLDIAWASLISVRVILERCLFRLDFARCKARLPLLRLIWLLIYVQFMSFTCSCAGALGDGTASGTIAPV